MTVYSLTNALYSDTTYHAAGLYYTARRSWRQLSADEGAPGLINTNLDCIQAGITSHTHIGDPFHYSYLVSPPS